MYLIHPKPYPRKIFKLNKYGITIFDQSSKNSVKMHIKMEK